jgi:hypothetical protein
MTTVARLRRCGSEHHADWSQPFIEFCEGGLEALKNPTVGQPRDEPILVWE